jgi:8-oxo-dGTP diphosphatase
VVSRDRDFKNPSRPQFRTGRFVVWRFMTEIRQRVVCYITRNQRELLVFSHPPEYGTAGIQVPGGGMEYDETQAAAAIRETLEETGLTLQNPVHLGSRIVHLPDAKYPDQEFHYYWLEANTETRDSWTHFAEEKYLFTHRFVPLEQIGTEIELRWHMADFIPELQRRFTIRQRVVVYITRNRKELLVFEHDDPGLQAGTQVVAGGVDDGETLEAAAMREVFEEAGLELQNPILLGSKVVIWPGPKNPNQRWHFYWLEAPTQTPDAWDHTVTAGEDDMGMVYRQRFVKLEEVKLDWGLDAMLEKLKVRFTP